MEGFTYIAASIVWRTTRGSARLYSAICAGWMPLHFKKIAEKGFGTWLRREEEGGRKKSIRKKDWSIRQIRLISEKLLWRIKWNEWFQISTALYIAVKAGPCGIWLPSCCDHKRDSDPRPESVAAAYYSPCTQKREALKNAGTARKGSPHSRSWRRRESLRGQHDQKTACIVSWQEEWQTFCPDKSKKKVTRKPAYLI